MMVSRYDANSILGARANGGSTLRDAGELLGAIDGLGADSPWLDPRFPIGEAARGRLSAEEPRLLLDENIARPTGWD